MWVWRSVAQRIPYGFGRLSIAVERMTISLSLIGGTVVKVTPIFADSGTKERLVSLPYL